MFDCKKCRKEIGTVEFPYYHIDHHRGKKSSDEICSKCN